MGQGEGWGIGRNALHISSPRWASRRPPSGSSARGPRIPPSEQPQSCEWQWALGLVQGTGSSAWSHQTPNTRGRAAHAGHTQTTLSSMTWHSLPVQQWLGTVSIYSLHMLAGRNTPEVCVLCCVVLCACVHACVCVCVRVCLCLISPCRQQT